MKRAIFLGLAAMLAVCACAGGGDTGAEPSSTTRASSRPVEFVDGTPAPTAAPIAEPSPAVASPSAKATTKPTAKPTKQPTPKPTKKPSTVYYANCVAVRAAGKAPLHRGDPGYRAGLDRDNDGLACE